MEQSELIKFYTELMQGIITRMAGNSANCKTWAITIVAAILVFTFDKTPNKEDTVLWLCVAILAIFWILDAYYLGLERVYRHELNRKLSAISEGTEAPILDMLKIGVPLSVCQVLDNTLKAMRSFSTIGLYGLLIAGLIECISFGWLNNI